MPLGVDPGWVLAGLALDALGMDPYWVIRGSGAFGVDAGWF